MKKQIDQVKEFHQKFNAFISENPNFDIPQKVRDLRVKLIEEESQELFEAMEKKDILEVAKEISDLLYVVFGTINAYGLQDKMEEIFDEVHASNMSKLGEDGKPIYREDGKVVKGPNFFKADVGKILG